MSSDSFKKIMKKYNDFLHSKKLFNVLSNLSFILLLIISIVWIFIILFQFAGSQDISSTIKEYGLVSLTLCGFTLLSGIFEKKENNPEIYGELFKSSIIFLISFVIFIFCYGIFSIDKFPINQYRDIIFTLLLFGILLFVAAVNLLGMILIRHYLKEYAKIKNLQ